MECLGSVCDKVSLKVGAHACAWQGVGVWNRVEVGQLTALRISRSKEEKREESNIWGRKYICMNKIFFPGHCFCSGTV